MATGGTVITDTLALFVLAVVVGSVESDERAGVIVLRRSCWALSCLRSTARCSCPGWLAGCSRISARGQTQRILVLLAALTSSALVADRMGLEGIIGAFFAGLALNRLVPSGGKLMESVEFVGAVLLVPFFLLSTGMLLDPRQFAKLDVLLLAAASLAGRTHRQRPTASYLSARRLRIRARRRRASLFGLTLAQAAATLAAVTIGTEVGIFDEKLLSATLVVVLVTVVVGGIVTRLAARRLRLRRDACVAPVSDPRSP